MRLLLTGADGFTGRYIVPLAESVGYAVFALEGDLQNAAAVQQQVSQINPTHVIHLAGISQTNAQQELDYYEVNLLGTMTLLRALANLPHAPQKVILASTSHIYGNHAHSPIDEDVPAAPISQYAMSKLAMEYMSQPFADRLPIVIVRPFNYTGIGHAEHFVIPKIISHFLHKAQVIELGNIDVLREYNDVRDIAKLYLGLLSSAENGQTYNLASGRTHSLREVITILEGLSGHHLIVKTNPDFLRPNEIQCLSGNPARLEQCLGALSFREMRETLSWMLAVKK